MAMSSPIASPSAQSPDGELLDVLDRWALRLEREETIPVLDPLLGAFDRCRAAASAENWRAAIARLRPHPLVALFQRDPYTSWGFRKPRGYAGDAVLLDFVYGKSSGALLADVRPPGEAIHQQLMQHPASAALRARRDFLSARLGNVLRSVPEARILAVACGHLREADALDRGLPRPGRFVALDQDGSSLEVAQADHPVLALEPVCDSVLSLVRGAELGKFDYIYSAGLYDYLSDEFGRRLTAKLAGMLAPGGRLLIANMVPALPGAGYMEAVMDWWLIYRTVREFLRLSSSLGEEYKVKGFRRNYVAYLEIER